MVLSIIVLLVFTSHIHCDDHLLYRQDGCDYDGPYVMTGEIVNERPEYESTWRKDAKILFRDNQWVITYPGGDPWYTNQQQDLTPPLRGWVFCIYGTMHPSFAVHKVSVTPLPPVLSIQVESAPHIAGLYTLSNTTTSHFGYPIYNGSNGYIAVQYQHNGLYPEYNWYWLSPSTGVMVQMTKTYPSYSPAHWEGWDVEETESKTLVLANIPNRLIKGCSSYKYEGYFIPRSDKRFCNRIQDCKNNMDEKDCKNISLLGSMSITLLIVLVGAGLFLILRYSGIMDIHNTNMRVSRTVTNSDVDYFALGRLSNILIICFPIDIILIL